MADGSYVGHCGLMPTSSLLQTVQLFVKCSAVSRSINNII